MEFEYVFVVALDVFPVFLTLGGCSHHNQGAYVEAPPSALWHPIKASAVETYPLPTRRQERQSRMPPVRDLPKPTKSSSMIQKRPVRSAGKVTQWELA
jgi:hypothetical protein